MAQIRQNNEFYETHGLVTSDGNLVTADNPLPVTLGSENITINGDINIPTSVEINNDTGNPIPVTWEYGEGSSLIPWEVQVARGKVAGVAGLSISGYQPSVPDTWVPVWELASAYTYPASATQMRVWSESASDTNITLLITGLDSNYDIQTETITLTNGTTGVLTVKSYLRINSLNITALPMNLGRIHIGNSGKTETYACINNAETGRSQMSMYTVPNGYTFYLTQVNLLTNQTGSQTALYRSYTKNAAGVINTILTFPFVDSYNSRKVVARPYPAKTDIQWQAQSSSGTSRVGIQIEGYLIANSVA